MFEQGDIDWSNHANGYENMVGGVYDLEQAVTTAETIVETGVNGMNWSNTLMIVTSDHSNSYMRLQEELGKGNLPVEVVGAGKSTYSAGDVTYSTTGHTNELVSSRQEVLEPSCSTSMQGSGIRVRILWMIHRSTR